MLQTKNEDLPDMDFIADTFKNSSKEDKDEMTAKALDLMFKNQSISSAYESRMRGNIIDACQYGYL